MLVLFYLKSDNPEFSGIQIIINQTVLNRFFSLLARLFQLPYDSVLVVLFLRTVAVVLLSQPSILTVIVGCKYDSVPHPTVRHGGQLDKHQV